MAIRDDPLAAESMGVNVNFYKVLAFVISADFAGMCGSFFASFLSFLSPTSFMVEESILMIEMVILGGMGDYPAQFSGQSLLVAIPEYFQIIYQARMLIGGSVNAIHDHAST